MGNCKYCGQFAGLLAKSHKDCEIKHTQGLGEFETLCRAYFMGNASSHDVITQRDYLRANKFLSDEDIARIGDSAIRSYTDSIKRPFTPRHLSLVDEFINALGITPYSDGIEIHRDGANVKRMTIQGFDPWFVMNLMSMIAE